MLHEVIHFLFHENAERDQFHHDLFSDDWLDALRGQAPSGFYVETALGRILRLFELQSAVEMAVRGYAQKEGVRQAVEIPQLDGSFSTSQPVFMLTVR